MLMKFTWVMICIVFLSANGFGVSEGSASASSNKVFANLHFAVSVDYTSEVWQKLREGNEQVTVSAIIDQYGKQYMEEEGISYKEITIIPGDNAVFQGMPPTESSYRYKKNKKYLLTINIYSARKTYQNNILNCSTESGRIDFDIQEIQDKVLKFQCKLLPPRPNRRLEVQ